MRRVVHGTSFLYQEKSRDELKVKLKSQTEATAKEIQGLKAHLTAKEEVML